MSGAVATADQAPAFSKCRLCTCKLILGAGDDFERGLCKDCLMRPESVKFGRPRSGPVGVPSVPVPSVPTSPKQPRPFNAAERALIAKLHAFMPAAQLLDILNARLVADLGAAAVPWNQAQLQEEVAKLTELSARDGEWASLRKVIARARQSGLLASITLQMVDDFAVVFGLSSAQHMRLRDMISSAKEDAS